MYHPSLTLVPEDHSNGCAGPRLILGISGFVMGGLIVRKKRSRNEKTMKTKLVCLSLLLLMPASPAPASEPKASDFDVTFVVNSFLYIANDGQCLMSLIDGDTRYDVQWRTREGPGMYRVSRCPEHRSGERLQGRVKGGLKGYRVELLGLDPKGKPKIEGWYITTKSQ